VVHRGAIVAAEHRAPRGRHLDPHRSGIPLLERDDVALPLSRRRQLAFIFAVLVVLHFVASAQRVMLEEPRSFTATPPASVARAATVVADQIARRALRVGGGMETQPHLHPFGVFGEVNPTFLLVVFTACLTTVWLVAACSRYLRLPHARGVAVSCTAISMLLAWVIFFLA